MTALTPPKSLLAAYSSQHFADHGQAVLQVLTKHLERTAAGEGPVLPWVDPTQMRARWTLEPTPDLAALLERVATESNDLHHPGYVGHQVTSPLPAAALSEMVGAN